MENFKAFELDSDLEVKILSLTFVSFFYLSRVLRHKSLILESLKFSLLLQINMHKPFGLPMYYLS